METPNILKQKAAELQEYYQVYYPKAAPLAAKCFLNTIETTVRKSGDTYFVITGDIPAMWLRDSTSQLMHYVRYAGEDGDLREILEGVLKRQAKMVLIDPYANAFNEFPNGSGYSQDLTYHHPHVWERKYEVDSLCAPIYLGYRYWKSTGSTAAFDGEFREALLKILEIFRAEQDHDHSAYSFERKNCAETDTLPCSGHGNPVNYTGMTWSGFRPSDDRCVYGYLIPSEMMAVQAMKYAAEIFERVYLESEKAGLFTDLAQEIQKGIQKFGVVNHGEFGEIYAYETDGRGNYVLMDDANCPSLLSLPYLEYCDSSDPIYLRTRSFVLSHSNPYYFSGSVLTGIGSPHTPQGYVWPIGIIMQALTSESRDEILSCLDLLTSSHAGTGYMHESINANDQTQFTREWFAWANSLFAELLIRVKNAKILEKP